MQIGVEFSYLILVLFACTTGLAWIGYHVGPPSPADHHILNLLGIPLDYPKDRNFLLWMAVGFSGMIGGSCFALKWLYHSVAKSEWNCDRVLWRLIVPIISGFVAVFVSMLIASGILSIINAKFFSNFYGAAGIGWLVGYFSDNVLASLQNTAASWFGTLNDTKGNASKNPDAGQRDS